MAETTSNPGTMNHYLSRNRLLVGGSMILLLTLCWAFRIELLTLFNTIYPNALKLGTATFIWLSLPADLATMGIVTLVLLLIGLLPARQRALRHSLQLLVLLTVVVILFFGLGHFQIFEIPLTMDMLGQGLDTFWEEIVNSATYEITPELYRTLLLFTVASVLFVAFSWRVEARAALDRTRGKRGLRLLLLWAVPLLLVSCSGISSLSRMAQHTGKGRFSRGSVPRLDQLTANPLLTVLRQSLGGKSETHTAEERGDTERMRDASAPFRFGLDTVSRLTNRVFPRLNIPRGKRYNIVLYFLESTCQHYVGTNVKGRSVTPNWDRLSGHSFVSRNHYGTYPLSVSAMFSVLSSAYGHPSKMFVTMDHPGIKLKSLPEILKQVGYRTAVFQSSTLTIFDHDKYFKRRQFDTLRDVIYFKKLGHKHFTPLSVDDMAIIKPAVQWMAADRDKPFFMAVFPFMPHHPYVIPDKRYRIYSEQEIAREKEFKLKSFMRYLNSLHYADAVLGRFVDELERAGLGENTLVFLFADHGEAFYQHRWNCMHSFKIYEENIRLPFIIYNRSLFPRPYFYTGISRHIDIAPTILDLLQLPRPEEFEGLSLFTSHRQQLAYINTYWCRTYIGVRDGRWKYIRCMKTGWQELYDLDQDPWEQQNVALTRPDLTVVFKRYILNAVAYKRRFYKKVLARGFLP